MSIFKLKNQEIYLILKKSIFKILKKFLKIVRKSGLHSWPTKSYEVWILLQFILMNESPDKLVELGSGRSTHYLAEYCQKCDKNLYSIDQNFMYILRNWLGLRFSFIKKNFNLIFVPIKGDWFDVKKMKSIRELKNANFLLIDGPGGALNKGLRNSSQGLEFLKEYYPKTSIIIIDDLQREDIRIFTKEFIADRYDLCFLLLKYSVNTYNKMNNLILFCIQKEKKEKYLEFLKFTKISKFLVFDSDFYKDVFEFLEEGNI